MKTTKIEGMERLRNEYKDLSRNPIINYGLTVGLVDNNDLYKWKITLIGPKDTSYAKGFFNLNVIFPEEYPKKGPEIVFLTPIYHPNVQWFKRENHDSLGHVSVSFLNCWKPETTAREMLTRLYSIFYWANPDSGYSLKISEEMRNNRSLYESKVKFFTKKYANILKTQRFCDKTWDFTCNENDLKSVETKEEKKIIKSNNNDNDSDNNYNIIVYFSDNGRRKIGIDCNINDLASVAIQKYITKSGTLIDGPSLYIYLLQQIDMHATLKENGINNKLEIVVIYDAVYA